jgi:hypothetical protein
MNCNEFGFHSLESEFQSQRVVECNPLVFHINLNDFGSSFLTSKRPDAEKSRFVFFVMNNVMNFITKFITSSSHRLLEYKIFSVSEYFVHNVSG